jgi:hypothetical protein
MWWDILRRMKWIALLALIAAPLGAQTDRLDWFRDDKFGMFVHFGPYSMLAGEWKSQRVPVGDKAERIHAAVQHSRSRLSRDGVRVSRDRPG